MDRKTDLDSGIEDLYHPSHGPRGTPEEDPGSWAPPEHPQPLAVIVTNEENHSFSLHEKALEHILLRPDICDLHVAIISVAGAFRKGKSFLLNFFLRYLRNRCNSTKNDPTNQTWLGTDDELLKGFNWRGGSERETSGMLLWSEPFIFEEPNGEKIAVLLMDTQGTFDSQSTVKDCATVFALSTMVSSVQIFNLSQNMQEDDLQHLQLFTEYGRLALEAGNVKPFQNLIFLIRDWSFPYEATYGFDGGRKILDRRLQIMDKQHPELQQLRKHIKSCFTKIECFLMPHPGLKVSTSPEFRGQLLDVENHFKEGLKSLIPEIVGGEHFVLKEINGEKVTCRELLQYFRAYIKIFQGEELPEPKSMLLATAEANNLAAVASAKVFYCRGMEELCGGETPYMSTDELEGNHRRLKDGALRQFSTTRKMGGAEFSQGFLQKLDDEILESYDNFVKSNNGKNFFRSARTPAVFFVFLVVVYLMQELFQLFAVEMMASLCSTFLGCILLTMCIWFYARYSGNLREIGQSIDELATSLWDNILSPTSKFLVQEGAKHAAALRLNETLAPSHATASQNGRRIAQPTMRR